MEPALQVAALPVRRNRDGSCSVLLVTSRQTRRWVIPKGWPQRDREDHAAAAQEAREEAGVLGAAHTESVGSYVYRKRRRAGVTTVRVKVYLLAVTEELADWPEREQRERAWFTPAEAAAKVDEPELRDLLRQADWGLR
jgi:8-oxo-dGTP pyrophosphatase MutT (NUDIX family)